MTRSGEANRTISGERHPHPRTLSGHLSWRVRAAPEQTFVVGTGSDGSMQELTFANLDRRARAFAALLTAVGVVKGDTVHVQLGNCPEFLVGLFGVAHLGAVLVPTHPSATVDDVIYVTSHAGCRVSVVTAEQVPVIASVAEMVPELTQILSVSGPAVGAIDVADAADVDADVDPVQLDGGELAAVLYTSGTSGWPKGVMVTHANLLFAGQSVAELFRMRPADRWLVTLPLSHANALIYQTMSAFVTGASVALIDRFDPATWAHSGRRHSATLASLFAVHARQLLAEPATASASEAALKLRLTVFAQHLQVQERAEFERRFGTRLIQVYGLTETLAPTLCEQVYGPPEPDTVGRPTSWVQTRLVDDDGCTVPAGVPGQLQVQGVPGVTLMSGYLSRPEDTERVLRDGWLFTGDQMRLLADGSYAFLGRAEEILKPGVDNVSTAEIERVLLEHVSVADAAVIGIQQEDQEEEIVAFVVLRPGDDATTGEVFGWARERLSAHKVPHRLLGIEELPRSAVGKVLRRDLRQRARTP
ncbi:MAG: AMP-binding protein [Actinomycetota bacterium]|nr:AMP-binding protein [Actinomycetota bacterium]